MIRQRNLTATDFPLEEVTAVRERRTSPSSIRYWRDFLCLGILLLVWLAVWLPRLSGPIDLRSDGGTYYVLGSALAKGHGYRLLN